MNLKNCPACGKMYVQNSFGICESCKAKEEDGFNAIRDYIENNSNCTLGELSMATGVSIRKIMGYIREGRLLASDGMAGEITCKACGVPVIKGNFCDDCAVKLNKGIKGLYEDREEKTDTKRTGIKMNIKDKL